MPSIVSNFVAQNATLVLKEIGTYPEFEHRIQLVPEALPVAAKVQPLPYAIEGKVVDVVQLLDQQGIWEKADKGDWAHPMVRPAKPDGTVQVTTDLSRLNKFVVPTRYPLPRLSEIFQKVWGSAFFSTLDLMKAYHHISLHPDSRPLTLTIMPLGLRQYIKMLLGLMDSGAVFQRRIQEALVDCLVLSPISMVFWCLVGPNRSMIKIWSVHYVHCITVPFVYSSPNVSFASLG